MGYGVFQDFGFAATTDDESKSLNFCKGRVEYSCCLEVNDRDDIRRRRRMGRRRRWRMGRRRMVIQRPKF